MQYQNLPKINDYFGLDVNLSWHYKKHVELSVIGRNLLQNKHLEFVPIIQRTVPAEIPRSVYVKLEVKF